MDGYEELRQAVVAGDEIRVLRVTRRLLEVGADPIHVINRGLVEGMERVGKLLMNHEIFIPDVLQSAKAMKAGMELVKRRKRTPARRPLGKVVLGTVKGDIHDIGKNLVGMMLESAGFLVYDLGVDVDPQQFVDAVKKHEAQILAMSAQLTTTMLNMKFTIEALKSAELRERVSVIIGGLPTSQDFADEIGADGYAPDASSAVNLCKKILRLKTTGEGKSKTPLSIVDRIRRRSEYLDQDS